MQPIGMEMQAEVEMEQSVACWQRCTCGRICGSGGKQEILVRPERNTAHQAALLDGPARAGRILFSLLALIVLAVPMAIVALVIWADSPGASPIFSQDRVGRDGKIFKFYKFRSMIPNAEARLKDVLAQNEMDGPVFKMKNDPRITRVGHFIRRTSIDELPQLINILKGDMSIVGPRPALPREVAQYTDYERQRLYVTPGLTCYWQIQPNRNELTFDEWMELDLKYIQDRNFWLDWKLIFQTIWAVLRMYGA